jgi:calcium-dependent protein kinase
MGVCGSKKAVTDVVPINSSGSPVKFSVSNSPVKDQVRTLNLKSDEAIGQFILLDSTFYADIQDYYLLKTTIGHGQFGQVRLAVHKLGNKHRKFAIKIVPKEKLKTNFQVVKREIQSLKLLDHPNIVKIYEVFEDSKNLSIVMDYFSGGELYDRLEKKTRYPEVEAAVLMYSLFHSISHMHRKGIAHRDLKPENFLFETKREESGIKVIDFGLANRYDLLNNEMHTVVGTPYYVAPEVLRQNYGKECDLWSLGVIMYAILAGFPPFNGASDQEIKRKILKGDYHFNHAELESVSKEAKALIKSLLSLEAAKRISAAEALNHPWFAPVLSRVATPLDVAVARRIKAFRSGGKLRREALKVICQFLTNEEIRPLIGYFRSMDKGHIGFIVPEDMEAAVREADPEGGFDLRGTLQGLDLFEGLITYSDYLIMTINPEAYLNEEVLHAAFNHFDTKETGFITLEDVRKVFTSSGKVVLDDEIHRLMAEYDFNNDGKLDFDELSKMMNPVKASQGKRPF